MKQAIQALAVFGLAAWNLARIESPVLGAMALVFAVLGYVEAQREPTPELASKAVVLTIIAEILIGTGR